MVAVLTLALSLGATGGVEVNPADAALTIAATAVTSDGTLSLTTSLTAGAITIGLATGTGDITLGSSSDTQSVLIGNGAGASTVSIANAAGGNTVNIGTNNAAADDINIGSALDAVSITGDDWSITDAGVFATAGNITQTGATTFSTGTGTISLNGDVTVATGKDILMQGTGTFTVGSGAVDLGTGDLSLGGDATVATTKKIQFRDTGLYINSSTDGQLDIDADTEVEITATTVDLNGILDVSGALTIVAGSLADASVVEDDLAASLVFDDDDLINLAATDVSGTAEGLILPQHATDCSVNGTAEGQVCWEADADTLYIGNGTGVTQAIGNVSGDNTWTGSNVFAPTTVTDVITIGKVDQTGTITLGLSTTDQTINIGNAATADTEITAINIGAGTPVSSGKSVITIGNNAAAGATTVDIKVGSGAAFTVTGVADSTIALGTGIESGLIAIGASKTSNDITLGATNKQLKLNAATGAVTIDAGGLTMTAGNLLLSSGTASVTSTDAKALAVGANGATNPVLQVDANTASVATGLKITGAAADGGGLALAVITSGTNDALTIDAVGNGTITLGGTSTGAIVLSRATGVTGDITGTSAGASALAVGRQGATSPALQVDASSGTSVTGLKVTAGDADGGLSLAVVGGSAAEELRIDAKGSDKILIGDTSTGNIEIGDTSGGKAVVIATSTGNTTVAGTLDVTGATTFTAGAQSASVARTANTAGAGDSVIANGSSFVTVTSSVGTKTITLPTPTPGNIVWLYEASNGYELRSSAPATVKINGGGTDAAHSSTVAATELVRCVCTTSTTWVCNKFGANGTEAVLEPAQ